MLLAALLPLIGKKIQEWFEALFTRANKAVEKKFTGNKQTDVNMVLEKAHALAIGHPLRRLFIRRAKRAGVLSMTAEDKKELMSMSKVM
jgi:hypothetical protein